MFQARVQEESQNREPGVREDVSNWLSRCFFLNCFLMKFWKKQRFWKGQTSTFTKRLFIDFFFYIKRNACVFITLYFKSSSVLNRQQLKAVQGVPGPVSSLCLASSSFRSSESCPQTATDSQQQGALPSISDCWGRCHLLRPPQFQEQERGCNLPNHFLWRKLFGTGKKCSCLFRSPGMTIRR